MFVCPSVTLRYSVETAIHIIKLFSPQFRHTIVVLQYGNIPTGGEPLTGALSARSAMKNRDLHTPYSKVSFQITLNDFE